MQTRFLYVTLLITVLIAVPISIFTIQTAGKNGAPRSAMPGDVPGAADAPLTRAEQERLRRFEGQFGEANAGLAMTEADRLFDGIINRLNGPITVEGTVRSSDGSPLPEVLIEVGSGAASMSWYPEGNEEQEIRTDGPFEFSADSVNWIQLKVSAPGFYRTFYRVRRDFDPAEFDKLIEIGADVAWDSQALVVRDIDIVLTPVSDIPELQEFGGGVRTTVSNGPTFGMDVSMIGVRSGIGREIREWPSDRPMIVAFVPTDAEGAPIEWVSTRIPDKERPLERPLAVELVMPEGWGIQIVELEGGPSGEAGLVNGMPTAPEDGYEQRITLTADDLFSIWDPLGKRQNAIYFYFTSPLGYGKGLMQGVRGDAEDGEISWGMSFYLQPNGSRDTRTPPHQ